MNISSSAFGNCSSLTSLFIPASVTGISANSVIGCSSLTEILVAEDSNSYCSLDGCLYAADKKTFICYPAGRSGDYIIPDGVTRISSGAFNGCSKLTSITLPESLTSIFTGAFYGCTGLTDIAIPEGVTSISSSAFGVCSGLTSVTFTGDIPTIGNYAFTNVTATVYYPAGNTTYTADSMQNYGGELTWVAVGTLPEPDGILPAALASIEEEAFSSCAFRYVVIPDGATTIGKRAFADSPNLAFVYIPASVTSIESDAFDGVENLTILGSPDSYAETFAAARGIAFVEG